MPSALERHKPVLINRLLEIFNEYFKNREKEAKIADLTFGSGNYSRALLSAGALRENFLCIDRDPTSEEFNEEKFKLIIANFSEITSLNLEMKFDFLMADLGTSLTQLKSNRGFSFNDDNLDMRMGTKGMTGEAWLRSSTQSQLFKSFQKNGVKNAYKIAGEIKNNRLYSIEQMKKIKSIYNNKKVNPLTKILQAIRIEVNNEDRELNLLLETVHEVSKEGAILLINTFHSGEEKIVKEFMSSQTRRFRNPIWKNLKTIKPTLKEIEENIAIRSVKMRVYMLEFN